MCSIRPARCLHAAAVGRRFVPGGEYELTFWVGDYFRQQAAADGILFLNLVPIRFRVSNGDENYHIPLLLAPGGYSTYRGS
ncbi:hydroxyisourate hydrolase [Paenibacillus sp. AR247]|uniref:hydroxyisourate hydrolase n=1 Tax=Paenibacillus sp. AR247 TaxID=1631599 RepID=UPI002157C70E|nr:hydroxyisourate hydrolase [Paenibacillus sp. AR247]